MITMKKAEKLNILKNSGYSWAEEAAEMLEEMAKVLDTIVQDNEPIRTLREVKEVLQKFNEWK